MGVRLQSSLGGIEKQERVDKNTGGLLCLAKVLQVNYKWHTCVVELLKYGEVLGSSNNEGKLSCKILEHYAGVDSSLNTDYGTLTPIQEGSIVVVGFIDNKKNKPIVLGCVYSGIEHSSILTTNVDETRDISRYRNIKVSRQQDYIEQDGLGDIELYHHSRAYLKASTEDINENTELDEDLSKLRDYTATYYRPLNIVASIRDRLSKTSNYFKILISSVHGIFRLSRILQDTSTKFEMTNSGSILFKRNLASNAIESDSECNNYSIVELHATGEIELTKKDTSKSIETSILIDNKGEISLKTNTGITAVCETLDAKVSDSARIKSNSIELNAKNITLGGDE